MQILTRFIIVCALAAVIAPFSSRGADTDAQMKAREALRQKMSELEAQPVLTNAAPPQAAPAPAKPPKTKAKPAPAPKPVVTQPPPAPAETVKTVPTPAPTPTPTPALRRSVEPPPMRTTPPPTPAPPPVARTKPAPAPRTAPASGHVTASRPDSERIAKAREALESKMSELNAQGGETAIAGQPAPGALPTPPPRTTSTSTRTHEISSTSRPMTTSDTAEALPAPPPRKRSVEPQAPKRPRETRPTPESRPMYPLPQGPPPPVSADKVAKLNALLQQYQADRITPEQYHDERAKILAGP